MEEAIKSGIAHDVLAELTDVIYLTLNLGQECGLQNWLEEAFLVKHSDNMRKQHDSVTHLSWTRTAHARACNCTEESLNFTVSRNSTGRWFLYSNGKLIKPYDYVPSDYSQLLNRRPKGESEAGSDHPERASRLGHTSGHDSSRYTFANVGIQASLCDRTPYQVLPRLIDDPVTTLEQTVMDLRLPMKQGSLRYSQTARSSTVLCDVDGNHYEATSLPFFNISVDS